MMDLAEVIERRKARAVTWFVPVKTKNPNNTREHWRVVHARGLEEKELTIIEAPKDVRPVMPVVVVLTRYASSARYKMDRSGIAAACKHIEDGVAEWCGVDDADPRFRVVYEQEKCKRGGEGVGVAVIQGARIVETLVFVEDA